MSIPQAECLAEAFCGKTAGKEVITLLEIVADTHAIRVGAHFAVSFQRTLRIPDNDKTYPLPPGLGAFPVYDASRCGVVFPGNDDRKPGTVFFIPMYQREALWLGFRGASWNPNAVMIFAGGVNAISGAISGGDVHPIGNNLSDRPQNYVVTPLQPWLDGFNTGDGTVRQFVAMPLGLGYTVESSVTGKEQYGRIDIAVFEPRPGRFPDAPPPEIPPERRPLAGLGAGRSPRMGLGAGGVMQQKIYPDPHGLGAWDPDNYGRVTIHIVNSAQFREIAGEDPPPTPVDAAVYTRHGFPWFALYDQDKGDVSKAAPLAEARTVRERDLERGINEETNPFEISGKQVKKLSERDAGPNHFRGRREKQEP